MEEYFKEELSSWNNINKVILNLSKRIYKEKFQKEIKRNQRYSILKKNYDYTKEDKFIKI